jgi:hypothetical protein
MCQIQAREVRFRCFLKVFSQLQLEQSDLQRERFLNIRPKQALRLLHCLEILQCRRTIDTRRNLRGGGLQNWKR